MEETTPRMGRPERQRAAHRPHPIGVMVILIILAESAAVAYFYAKYYSQNLVTISLQDKLTLTREEVIALEHKRRSLEKSMDEKKQAIRDPEQRLGLIEGRDKEAKDDAARKEQIAAYLRKRLKESKEMEMQMHERVEELSRKQSEMETRMAQFNLAQGAGTPIAQDIQLKETVVAEAAPSISEIAGQILILNDTYNFIILNVGSDDGIDAGDEGAIERDGVQIGRAKVKKLYNKMCLADIVETSQDAKVQKNFLVKFTLEPDRNRS